MHGFRARSGARAQNCSKFPVISLLAGNLQTETGSFVALGPDVIAGFGLDQLRCDAQTITALADAAFEDIAHAELAADLFYADGAALVGKTRIERDNKEPPQLGQRGGDVLDHAVGKNFLLWI